MKSGDKVAVVTNFDGSEAPFLGTLERQMRDYAVVNGQTYPAAYVFPAAAYNDLVTVCRKRKAALAVYDTLMGEVYEIRNRVTRGEYDK